MSRSADMPFGARVRREGGTDFRLWAPAATCVDVCLEDAGDDAERAMQRAEDGWFRLHAPDAGAGARYRYRIDGDLLVPDPATRAQADDVHGPSVVVDPDAYAWKTPEWTGRPWHEAVVCEVHVGTFSPEGTFAGAARRLDHLVETGVTAIELMPVADFPGARNWGYDGVLPFAPDRAYGTPDDMRALVDDAHDRGLMVFLDVVYNHFGPEGNYLHAYAPFFFTDRFETPWGAAIDFSVRAVRDFFAWNAVHWIEEYRLDGLRLDAVHAIRDESVPHILTEIAERVHARIGDERHVHLVLENGANEARWLEREAAGEPRHYVAQWNDDLHHALHVSLTGESDGYYRDFADDPARHLARALAEGFAYQGEPSAFRGHAQGEPSAHLPPAAFVSFLQNHDQIGNRALGDRIDALAPPEAVRAALAVVLLAPSPPMLFMGEEWGAGQPFPFFCDFADDLADAVREGRRREFARFAAFRDPAARERIPDPNAEPTFESARLDWSDARRSPHAERLALVRELLALRHAEIVPRLAGMEGSTGRVTRHGERGASITWRLGDGALLRLDANLGDVTAEGLRVPPADTPLWSTADGTTLVAGALPPWSAVWWLDPGSEARPRRAPDVPDRTSPGSTR